MTLTPEQFNLLATKEDLKNFITREEFKKELNERFNQVNNTLDYIVQKLDKFEQYQISNTVAHDRINRDLFKLKKHTKLESMEVVEPLQEKV